VIGVLLILRDRFWFTAWMPPAPTKQTVRPSGLDPKNCAQGTAGPRGEQGLDRVEPGVHVNVIEHKVNDHSGRHLSLDGIQEARELLMPEANCTAADNRAVEHVEDCKSGWMRSSFSSRDGTMAWACGSVSSPMLQRRLARSFHLTNTLSH